MREILIVEDDKALNQGISLALGGGDVRFDKCHDLRAARSSLAGRRYDLVILDINLPDGSGLDLLTELRQKGDTPVILLTANDLETDVVAGFALGADDYITKPFSLAILRARAEAQLRRGGKARQESFVQGDYVFDFDRLEFARAGVPVELSKTEQKLLRLLVENRGHAVPRERLLDRVWTDGAEFVDENALSVAVKRLRDKLGRDAPIRTVYGVGYCWETA